MPAFLLRRLPTFRQPSALRYSAGGRLLHGLGALFLLAGAVLGWILPHVVPQGFTAPFWQHLTISPGARGIDTSGYFSAILTASAVLVAVAAGLAAAMLQLVVEEVAPQVARSNLAALRPFLLAWIITTGVVLFYLLYPPAFMSQLWQILLWFLAVVFLMLAYLWWLPWYLSGAYAVESAMRQLQRIPLRQWEEHDAYYTIQSSFATAVARGDLGTVANLAGALGIWLTEVRTPEQTTSSATSTPTESAYRQFRALKNLLLGCGQGAATAPPFVAYHLGHIVAGALLQLVAASEVTPGRTDIFNALVGSLAGNQAQIRVLWAGIRHALCRRSPRGIPYLVRFWQQPAVTSASDPHRIAALADTLLRCYWDCGQRTLPDRRQEHLVAPGPTRHWPFHLRWRWRVQLRPVPSLVEAAQPLPCGSLDATMLTDLYRYLIEYLDPVLRSSQPEATATTTAQQLLMALHERARPLFNGTDPERAHLEHCYQRHMRQE